MTLGQIERGRLASDCFRNSFERNGIFTAGRLPWLFFDFGDVYLAHFRLLSFRSKWRNLLWSLNRPRCLSYARHDNILFFAVEVICLGSFHDQFLHSIRCYRPFAAVWIETGITCFAAAARIIRNDIVNKIFVSSVAELVRFPWLEEECVTRPYFSDSILITHAA